MKKLNTKQEWDELPANNKLFLTLWKLLKGYVPGPYFCKCDLEEIAFALSLGLSHDTSLDYGTYDNVFDYQEYTLMWDGAQPYDILWYKLNENIKRRVNQHLIVNS